MASQGYIYLERKIFDDPLYLAGKFSKGQALIDLIFLASYARGEFEVRGIKVVTERGQFAFAEHSLATRWGWSRQKVRCFLAELEKRYTITTNREGPVNVYTLVNYEKYQNKQPTDQTTDQTIKNTTEKPNISKLSKVSKEEVNNNNSSQDVALHNELLELANISNGGVQ